MSTDRTLSWHREYRPGRHKRVVTGVKAWATSLDPAAPLPPYYRIERVDPGRAARIVYLINCKVCGGDKIRVHTLPAFDLEAAKAIAQRDYDKRRAEQTTATPVSHR